MPTLLGSIMKNPESVQLHMRASPRGAVDLRRKGL